MPGYIKLYRDLADTDLWLKKKPFDPGKAWVDLLMAAAWRESEFFVRGAKVQLQRGDVGMSMLTMGKRWGWSRGRVDRFLNDLETRQQIVQKRGQLTTVVSICNYSKYQDGPEKTVQQTGQQNAHIKEVKNNNARPSPSQVQDYMVERGWPEMFAGAQSDRFVDYYASVGWKVGKKPMKDWKAAARGWMTRCKDPIPTDGRRVTYD